MQDVKLGEMEAKFAEMIWERAPVASGELVKLCEEELAWKKSTTYTMLRRLCQRGIFKNEGGQVTAVQTREEFAALQSEQFVQRSFGGSLPRFVAAFSSRKKLSAQEIEQLQALIDRARGKTDAE